MYHPSYDVDTQLIQKYAKKGGLDIVDYGSGNGVLLKILSSNRVKSYLGLEVSEAALKVANAEHAAKNVAFKHITPNAAPSLGKDSSKDLIILIGVFQYLNDTEIEHVVSEAQRVLRKGGVLVASCVTDHWIYRMTNVYQLFFPNRYINRNALVKQLQAKNILIQHNEEKGLLVGPLFSHGLVIVFDALDKLLFRNKGKLGPIGITMRQLFKPLMMLEYQIPIDFGYTLFLVGKKT